MAARRGGCRVFSRSLGRGLRHQDLGRSDQAIVEQIAFLHDLRHGVGFGLIGFLFVFMLFEGDLYAAPAWAIAFMSFCFGLSIGAMWEIFEFAMDQIFGLNMQKSGLIDTMWDLILDTLGAGLGATAGFLYVKGRHLGGLTGILQEFIQKNRRFFRKLKR